MATSSPSVNPESGSTLTVPMGQTLVVELTFDNPSAKVRTYDLAISGPATQFAAADSSEVHVAPFETGVARVTFSPTGQTTPDDYPIELKISEDGELIDPPGAVSLLIEVEYAEVIDYAAIEAARLAEQEAIAEAERLAAEEQARIAAAEAEKKLAEEKALQEQQALEIAAREQQRRDEEAAAVARQEAEELEKSRREAEEAAQAQKQAEEQAARELAEKAAVEERARQEALERERAEAAKQREEEAREAKRIAEEAEAARLAAAEIEAQRQEAAARESAEAEKAQVAERKAAQEAERKQRELQNAKEQEAKQAAEAQKTAEAEREAQQKAEEVARNQEAQKLAEEVRVKQIAEAKARAAEEEANRQAAEEQRIAQIKAAEEQARLAAEAKVAEEVAEATRRAEEEAKRQAAEEQRMAETKAAEEKARLAAEAKAAEEAAEAMRRAEEESKRQAAEEARKQEMAKRADEERVRLEAEDRARAEAAAKKQAIEDERRAAEEARKQEMARRADEERAKLEAEAQARATEEAAEAKRRAQVEAERRAKEEQARIDAAKKLKEEAALEAEIEAPAPKVVDGSQFLQNVSAPAEKQALVSDFKADRIITDAKNGTQILVKPGETVLLKFTVRHEVQKGQRPSSRTFRLQHNRALKDEWIDIVVPTLNVKPNGTGELAVMLRPPLDAEPANYPFAVEVGVQGQVFVPSQFVLTVQPVPVVQVEAEATVVKVGPFGRNVPFSLKVASAGNSETAYRLAVKDPKAGSNDDQLQNEDIYESGPWQYNFDRELADLVSQSSDGKATPQKHHLTARRRGIWWFGFVEKHPVRVAAVPVTDPANGHKAVNDINLVAKRWRLIPMAAFLFWPLVLLLWMFFTGGSTTIEVMNGYPADDRRVIVLANSMIPKGEEARIPLQLKIERTSFLKPKLYLTQGKTTRELPLREGQGIDLGANDYVSNAQLILKDFAGRQLQAIDITAFGHRTDNFLNFAQFDNALQRPVPLTAKPDWMDIGPSETNERAGNAIIKTYYIKVPVAGARRIYLMNVSPTSSRLAVQLTITRRPTSELFSVSDFGQDEAKVETLQSQSFEGPLFKFRGDASQAAAANRLPEEERTWELVSTNGPERVIRFVLQVEGGDQ